ncbi:hypothetical protein [Lucifera butyrica]|nr:hypothetical protein [Lucifera butyrica]
MNLLREKRMMLRKSDRQIKTYCWCAMKSIFLLYWTKHAEKPEF